MRTYKRVRGKRVIWFVIVLAALLTTSAGKSFAQTMSVEFENGDNDYIASDYIYFDLNAGNVEISCEGYYKGYIYAYNKATGKVEKATVEGDYKPENTYYVYQSSDTNWNTTGLDKDGNMVLPEYDAVTYGGKSWSDYITNNDSVEDVITNWNEAIGKTGRTSCDNYIKLEKVSADIVLDNVYTTYAPSSAASGPINIQTAIYSATTITLRLKGDNRLRNIYYYSQNNKHQEKFIITSDAGNASDKGSLTVAPFTTVMSRANYPDCLAIIGANAKKEYGLTFSGGTVFAGFPAQNSHVWGDRNMVDFATCVGGGNNEYGEVSVTGGRLTAVSNGTSPAIGGGGGYNLVGGHGTVDISGGEVYAYATGIYSIDKGNNNTVRNPGFVPTTAIGGSSTFSKNAKDGTEVTITGGYVYAQSLGGTAIGGGNSQASTGGSATVNISGDAKVEAVSIAGIAGKEGSEGCYEEVSASNAIGGGCGVSGGEATVNISGECEVAATSIGGGTAYICKNNKDTYGNIITGNGGKATVNISGGTTTLTEGIGGGDSEWANGGAADVTVEDGTIVAGAYIGGGIGCVGALDKVGNGGDADINVSGGTIITGTIGGGATKSKNASSHIGYANASITGGDIQGQFLLQKVSTDASAGHCKFFMSGGTIHDTDANDANYANRQKDGGAVWMGDTNGDVEITGGTIESCAANNGGAIYMTAGNVEIAGGTIKDCAANSGGAIYMTAGSVTLGEDVVLLNCTAKSGSGGAIYQGGGDVTVNGSTIKGNEAACNGGGVYVNHGDFKLNGGLISGNSALDWETLNSLESGNGGGVYVKNGSFKMDNGTVSDNSCSRFGGGIYVYAQADADASADEDDEDSIILKGGVISGNKAAQCGGGVTAFKTDITLTDADGTDGVTITDNEAVCGGGIYVRYNALLTMQGGSVSNNRAVSLNGRKKDSFYGAVASSKEATSLALFGDDQDFGGNGGGIMIHNASMKLNGAENDALSGAILNNSAERNGGGMYLIQKKTTDASDATGLNDTDMSATIENGNVCGNTAGRHGGGIAMFQPAEEVGAEAVTSISGQAEISRNTASCGGGFYVGGGTLTVSGGIMTENHAEGNPDVKTAYNTSENAGVGGGIYVYNLGKLSLKITDGESGNNEVLVNVGVYSNLADYAADDVYCAQGTSSEIDLPSVNTMYLANYEHHVIGRAIGWFYDYPEADSYYDGKNSEINSIRYRLAEDSKDEDRKVLYEFSDGETTRKINDYTCLTLGYKYLRINVTVENEVTPESDDKTVFEYTVTVKGSVSEAEEKSDLSIPALVFDLKDSNSYVGQPYTVVQDGSKEEGNGTAVIRFCLKSGESAVLEGIPINSQVTIEQKASSYITAHTYDGKTSLGTTFDKIVEDKYENVLFTNSKQGKTLEYYVPASMNVDSTENYGIMAILDDDDDWMDETDSSDTTDSGNWILYSSVTYPLGWEVSLEELEKLKYEGYYFQGWYYDEDTWDNQADSPFTMSENVVLYAGTIPTENVVSTPTQNTLSYYTPQGTVWKTDTREGTWYITGGELETYTDVPEGYEFVGWQEVPSDVEITDWLKENEENSSVISDTTSLAMLSSKRICARLQKKQDTTETVTTEQATTEQAKAATTEQATTEQAKAATTEQATTEQATTEQAKAATTEQATTEQAKAATTEQATTEQAKAATTEQATTEQAKAATTEQATTEQATTEQAKAATTEQATTEQAKAATTEQATTEQAKAATTEQAKAVTTEQAKAATEKAKLATTQQPKDETESVATEQGKKQIKLAALEQSMDDMKSVATEQSKAETQSTATEQSRDEAEVTTAESPKAGTKLDVTEEQTKLASTEQSIDETELNVTKQSKDGTKTTVKKQQEDVTEPVTGDDSPIVLWLGMVFVGALFVATYVVQMRRKKDNK